MRATFLQIDGGLTRVLHEGDGPPLILVHGLGTSAERWAQNIDTLARSYSVYAIDLFNSGFSADIRFTEKPPQKAHIEQLQEFCNALGIKKASLAGSSYGGLVVSLLALERPDLVDKLVIVGSGSALHPPDEQKKSLQAARENGLRALKAGGLAALRKRMENIVSDPASVPENTLLSLLTANALPGRDQALVDLYDGIIGSCGVADAQVYHRLESISQPTLIVTGRDDIRAKWELAQEAARRIPRCELHIYEKCGHAPMQEHPERFNGDLLRFLGGQG